MAAEQVAILAQKSLEIQRQTNLLKTFLAKFCGQAKNNEPLATWLSNYLTYNEQLIRELHSIVHMVMNDLMPTIRWQCWELDDVVPSMGDVKQWYSQLIDVCLDVKESMEKVRLDSIPRSLQSLWCDRITPLYHELTNCRNSLLANPIALSRQPEEILRTTKLAPIQVTSLCGKRSFPPGAMPKMKVILINEDQAKLVHQFGFPNGIQKNGEGDEREAYEACGTLTEDTAAYTKGTWKFPKLSISEVQRNKPSKSDSVLEEKYCFLIYNTAPVENQIWWCCSRPFFVVVNNSQNSKVTTLAFIEESFRSRNRKPFDVPESVPCSKLIAALEKYFMRRTSCQRGFTPKNKAFLRAKLLKHDEAGPGENPLVHLERLGEKLDGCAFTFFEWFTGIIVVVNEHLKTYWENGFIIGFFDRLTTEGLLSNVPDDGAFIIRFSESELSAITISYTLKFLTGSITASLLATCDDLKKDNLPEILQSPIPQIQQLPTRYYTKVYFYQVSNSGDEILTWEPKSAAFPPLPPGEPAETAAVPTRNGYVKWAVVKLVVAIREDVQGGEITSSDLHDVQIPSRTLQWPLVSDNFPALRGPEQFLVSSDLAQSPVTSNLSQFPVTTDLCQFLVPSDIVQFPVTSSHGQFPGSTGLDPCANPIGFDQLLDPTYLDQTTDPEDVDRMLFSSCNTPVDLLPATSSSSSSQKHDWDLSSQSMFNFEHDLRTSVEMELGL